MGAHGCRRGPFWLGTVLRQSRRIARRAEPPARGRLTTRSSVLVGTIERLENRTRRICNGERVPPRRGSPWRWPGIPRRIAGPFGTSAAKPSGSRRSLRHHIPDSVPTACPGHRYALQESSALRRSRGDSLPANRDHTASQPCTAICLPPPAVRLPWPDLSRAPASLIGVPRPVSWTPVKTKRPLRTRLVLSLL
jgi:hypothetical protein